MDELPRWAKGIERLLNQTASQVRGNQQFQADRIADLVEQIDELRQKLAALEAWKDEIERLRKTKNQ